LGQPVQDLYGVNRVHGVCDLHGLHMPDRVGEALGETSCLCGEKCVELATIERFRSAV
jgi:hypothetical protein